MKFLRFALFLLFSVKNSTYSELLGDLEEEHGDISSIAIAINDITTEFFVKQNFDFHVSYQHGISGKAAKVLNLFLDKTYKTVPTGVFEYTLKRTDAHKVGGCFVLFLQTFDGFLLAHNFFELIRVNTEPMIYIIYIDDVRLEEFYKYWTMQNYRKLHYSANGLILYGFFILNQGEKLLFATIEWFTENYCDDAHIIIKNVFDKRSKTWVRKLEYFEKFLDYHGCELIMLLPTISAGKVIEHTSGFVIVGEFMRNFEIHGITPKINEITAIAHNYKAVYQPGKISPHFLLEGGRIYVIPINNTARDTFHIYFEMVPSYKWYNHIKLTNAFVDFENYFVATPAEFYSAYEKLAMPFDFMTWMLLLVTFAVAFLTILAINKLSKRAKNIVYGEQIKNPFWNVVSIFFGISQTRLPEQNFSRFILVLFVGFCLIFRTCFQSKMFEFMTSEPRRPPPKRLSDLLDRSYKILTMYSGNDILKQNAVDEYGRNLSIETIDIFQFKRLFQTQSQNDTANVALLLDEYFVNFYENTSKKDYSWTRMEERLFVSHEALGFPHFAFFFRMFKKVCDNLIDSGVMKYLVDSFYVKKIKFVKIGTEPKVLSLKTLAFGFNIFIGCCIISLCAFVGEKVVEYEKNQRKAKIKKNQEVNSRKETKVIDSLPSVTNKKTKKASKKGKKKKRKSGQDIEAIDLETVEEESQNQQMIY